MIIYNQKEEREVNNMTNAQKEILALATEDLKNGVNTEWALFVIASIEANEKSE